VDTNFYECNAPVVTLPSWRRLTMVQEVEGCGQEMVEFCYWITLFLSEPNRFWNEVSLS
jgi:hypothetical protein